MTELRHTPPSWFLKDDPRDPPPDYEAMHRNPRIQEQAQTLTVVGFDPGETTGWSVMRTTLAGMLSDQPTDKIVTDWWHGQIDCGAKTGDAATSSTATRADLGISDEGEAMGASQMEQLVAMQFMVTPSVAIVLEDFILRTQNKSRSALSPVRMIHRFDQMMWERHIATWRSQPSEKTACTDDRLKAWGLYASDGLDHARDADRHAFLFLRKMRAKHRLIAAAYPALAVRPR